MIFFAKMKHFLTYVLVQNYFYFTFIEHIFLCFDGFRVRLFNSLVQNHLYNRSFFAFQLRVPALNWMPRRLETCRVKCKGRTHCVYTNVQKAIGSLLNPSWKKCGHIADREPTTNGIMKLTTWRLLHAPVWNCHSFYYQCLHFYNMLFYLLSPSLLNYIIQGNTDWI